MTIEAISSNATYKEVLADSFGGVMYDISNQTKYDPEDVEYIVGLWDALTPSEQSVAGGIMRGAIGFLKGE